MKIRAYLVHALSSLHAGVGQSGDVIDLPIALMRATGIPFLPGSSVKGVLREARKQEGKDTEKMLAVFGPEREQAGDHAGALVVGDARLLALPVRSFRGTFAWVSSPLLLRLAARDLGRAPAVESLPQPSAQVAQGNVGVHGGRLYLEDLDLPAREGRMAQEWADLLGPLVFPEEETFVRRLAVVDDETMAFLWETATQVDARVRIEAGTGTVASGALWLEESLPPETVLLGIVAAEPSRRETAPMTPTEVLAFALPGAEVLQLGGKASVGRGRCRLVPWKDQGWEHD